MGGGELAMHNRSLTQVDAVPDVPLPVLMTKN